MQQLVGVTGYAQHGKDTLGRRLVAAHGFTRYAFADALKSMALALDPIIDSTVPGGLRLSRLVSDYGWEHAKAYDEVRRFLQVLGTEGVREHIGEESWVQACERRILSDGAQRVVVTDVRFPNEAEWVRRCGGLLVRVDRVNADGTPFDNGVGAGHASEALIDTLLPDVIVTNDGTEAFLRAADSVVWGGGPKQDPCEGCYACTDCGPEPLATADYRYRRLDKLPAEGHLS